MLVGLVIYLRTEWNCLSAISVLPNIWVLVLLYSGKNFSNGMLWFASVADVSLFRVRADFWDLSQNFSHWKKWITANPSPRQMLMYSWVAWPTKKNELRFGSSLESLLFFCPPKYQHVLKYVYIYPTQKYHKYIHWFCEILDC